MTIITHDVIAVCLTVIRKNSEMLRFCVKFLRFGKCYVLRPYTDDTGEWPHQVSANEKSAATRIIREPEAEISPLVAKASNDFQIRLCVCNIF